MNFLIPKKNWYSILLFSFSAMCLVSCHKNSNDLSNNQFPDLTTKINSAVSGFVTNENNAAVPGASIQFGTANTTTDKYGYFEIKNVQVIKNAAVVIVTKPGYFKGIKTFIASQGKSAFFRIKLIPKTTSGNITGNTGGTVTLTNGMSISFPANGLINSTTNTLYTGTVNVAAYWIDPTASDLNEILPGDLRGLNTDGVLKLLRTYGMAAVELTSASGESLQIATGKKASISFPIPSSLLSSAPATIPLWYFNETNGLWKEEGSATKTGNNYVGEVNHFSFWNCDAPSSYIQFDCAVVDATGQPVQNVLVKVSIVAGSQWNSSGYGYTDSNGYTSGIIPNNVQLLLEIFSSSNCNTPIYTQNFTSGNINLSLSNITLPALATSTVSGTVSDCNGFPVHSGYVLVRNNNYYTRYYVTGSGYFNFVTPFCSNGNSITIIGENLLTGQESSPVILTLVNGANLVGNITTCNTSTQEYMIYNINGHNYSYSTPDWSFLNFFNFGLPPLSIMCYPSNVFVPLPPSPVVIQIDTTGIGLNSVQKLVSFSTQQNRDTPFTRATYIPVNITEYGTIGSYWAGNFTFTETGSSGISYLNTCIFRTKRRY